MTAQLQDYLAKEDYKLFGTETIAPRTHSPPKPHIQSTRVLAAPVSTARETDDLDWLSSLNYKPRTPSRQTQNSRMELETALNSLSRSIARQNNRIGEVYTSPRRDSPKPQKSESPKLQRSDLDMDMAVTQKRRRGLADKIDALLESVSGVEPVTKSQVSPPPPPDPVVPPKSPKSDLATNILEQVAALEKLIIDRTQNTAQRLDSSISTPKQRKTRTPKRRQEKIVENVEPERVKPPVIAVVPRNMSPSYEAAFMSEVTRQIGGDVDILQLDIGKTTTSRRSVTTQTTSEIKPTQWEVGPRPQRVYESPIPTRVLKKSDDDAIPLPQTQTRVLKKSDDDVIIWRTLK